MVKNDDSRMYCKDSDTIPGTEMNYFKGKPVFEEK